MSLSNQPRRLAATGRYYSFKLQGYISTDSNHPFPALALRPFNPQICRTCRLSLQIRHASFFDRIFRRKKAKKELPPILDPSSPEYLRSKPKPMPEMPARGDLASGSILDDEDKPPGTAGTASGTTIAGGGKRDPGVMAGELDPLPLSRMRWERKMVIRSIKKRGRLSKTERIMQTERQSLSKSPFIGTSIKKLFPLANQIAGKPIEEAIVQMRFSKKKAAQDVRKHLEYARDEAIVKRGMGLGQVGRTDEEAHDGEGTKKQGLQDKMRIVEDKNGLKRVVNDPTQIYVDQAWVGRGSFSRSPEYRARGRVNLLKHPTTSISVLLKEEKTRIRLEEERVEKRKNRKVWVPLPDRPVTAQRQYPLW